MKKTLTYQRRIRHKHADEYDDSGHYGYMWGSFQSEAIIGQYNCKIGMTHLVKPLTPTPTSDYIWRLCLITQ